MRQSNKQAILCKTSCPFCGQAITIKRSNLIVWTNCPICIRDFIVPQSHLKIIPDRYIPRSKAYSSSIRKHYMLNKPFIYLNRIGWFRFVPSINESLNIHAEEYCYKLNKEIEHESISHFV